MKLLITIALIFISLVSADSKAEVGPTKGTGIIDTHLHAFAASPDGLDKAAEWMKQNGVERAIVHPLPPSLAKNDVERQKMLANFKKYKGKIYRFCIFTHEEVKTVEEAVKKLAREKKDGAIGFGEHYGRGLMFDDPANMRIYEACGKVGLPVMFHMERKKNEDKVGLPHLEAALKANPKCIFIAHGPLWWKQLGTGACDRLLGEYSNFYADISAGSGLRALSKNKEFTQKFMIKHSKKLLFGTDCGWWTFKKKSKPALHFDLMKNLDLPEKVKSLIYGGNAKHVFQFKK